MTSSYAAIWCESAGPVSAGKLELSADGLKLEGVTTRRIAYADVGAARLSRAFDDRIYGRPALVLQLRSGGAVRIASVDGLGTIHEMAEALAGRLASPVLR